MIGLAAVGVDAAHAWMRGIADLSPAVTGSLVAAIWQGTLLAVAAGLGLRLLPKTPAAVRFAIWFGVFAVVALLPGAALWPRGSMANGASTPHAWLMLSERWCLAIVAVWAVASLVRAGTLVAAALRVRALWKRAKPIEMGTLEAGYADGRRAQICTSDEVDRPTVIGFFSPKILIPAWLLAKLTPAELEQIVLHEAGHLGRADDWMNLAQKIALVIFPLNPVLAWVERRLCFERELAVDERVLHALAGRAGAETAYAACLTTLAEYRLERRELPFGLALGALGRESQLGRRVGRILRRGERMRPLHAKLVLGGAMLGLLVAATGFERCPQMVGFSGRPATAPVAQQRALRAEVPLRRPMGRTHAVAVVFKTPGRRQLQAIPYTAHETMAVAMEPAGERHGSIEPAEREGAGRERVIPQPARMVETSAEMPGRARPAKAVSAAAAASSPGMSMQWVVVTTWQGSGETRMVLTTANLPVAPGGADAASSIPEAGKTSAAGQQMVRYAAVAVRGGWLVFQI